MIAFLQIIVMFVLHGLRDEHGTIMTVEGYVPEVAVHMMGLFQFFFFCEEVRLCTITIQALSRQVMTTTQP